MYDHVRKHRGRSSQDALEIALQRCKLVTASRVRRVSSIERKHSHVLIASIKIGGIVVQGRDLRGKKRSRPFVYELRFLCLLASRSLRPCQSYSSRPVQRRGRTPPNPWMPHWTRVQAKHALNDSRQFSGHLNFANPAAKSPKLRMFIIIQLQSECLLDISRPAFHNDSTVRLTVVHHF